MSVKLNLGVIDIPYGHAYGEDTVDPNITTGEVAQSLEERYRIMETFYSDHKEEITDSMAAEYAGILNDLFHGARVNPDRAIAGIGDDIKPLFHAFLDNKEMDGKSGVPTLASILGIQHRRKKVKYNPGRPSFEDSLMYRNSFKAWISNE
jgi:hypothetical protein